MEFWKHCKSLIVGRPAKAAFALLAVAIIVVGRQDDGVAAPFIEKHQLGQKIGVMDDSEGRNVFNSPTDIGLLGKFAEVSPSGLDIQGVLLFDRAGQFLVATEEPRKRIVFPLFEPAQTQGSRGTSDIGSFDHDQSIRSALGNGRPNGLHNQTATLNVNKGSVGLGGGIGGASGLHKGLPDQEYADTAQSNPYDSSQTHYQSPERHGALGIKIILVALVFASGVLSFCRAIYLGLAGKGDTGLPYMIVGVAGILSGVILGGLLVI